MISKKVSKLFLLMILLISVACSKTEENIPLTASVDLIDENKFVRKASSTTIFLFGIITLNDSVSVVTSNPFWI